MSTVAVHVQPVEPSSISYSRFRIYLRFLRDPGPHISYTDCVRRCSTRQWSVYLFDSLIEALKEVAALQQ